MLDFSLSSRPRLTPVRQAELSECGLACLTMIAGYHGLRTNLNAMRREFAYSVRGATLRTLMNVADRIGLIPRAVQLSAGGLKGLHLPCILHWNGNHFVVLERIKGGKARIHDPAGRSAWMPMEEVADSFSGYALEMRPGENFEDGRQHDKLRLSLLWHRIAGMKHALGQAVALGFLLEVFVLASPYYMQVAVDNALPALDGDLMIVLALGFGLLTLFNVAAMSLRSLVLLVAGTTLGYSITSSLVRRLFRLPVDWFERRHVGDVLSRFQSVAPLQRMLTEGAAAGMIDGTLAIFTLLLMFVYSAKLATIALVSFLLYGGVRWLSFSSQRSVQEDGIIAHSREQSMMIETLRGMTTLRLLNQETVRQAQWQNLFTNAVNADVRLARISIWQMGANTLISGLENILTVWIAIGLIIRGEGFSIGMLFAYIAYRTQFMQKATSLIDQGINLRVLGLHLERLSDIALGQEDRSFEKDGASETVLVGKIELRDVRFRYGPDQPFVLDGVNFMAHPGDHIAVTGPSGGGKTTFVKVLLGLLEPESGQILVDDVPLERFGYRRFRDQVSAVLQDDSLFAGSLMDNIGLSDEEPDPKKVVRVAGIAAIHDDIDRMPMRYESLVGDMGSALSGGQKQRVLLARALYRNPKLLVMDEGTAHLDAAHERAVNRAIGSMGVTRIIIAHRRETVEAAERVWTMVDGRMSEIVVGTSPGGASRGDQDPRMQRA